MHSVFFNVHHLALNRQVISMELLTVVERASSSSSYAFGNDMRVWASVHFTTKYIMLCVVQKLTSDANN